MFVSPAALAENSISMLEFEELKFDEPIAVVVAGSLAGSFT